MRDEWCPSLRHFFALTKDEVGLPLYRFNALRESGDPAAYAASLASLFAGESVTGVAYAHGSGYEAGNVVQLLTRHWSRATR